MTNTKKKTVPAPRLRFPGFEGEWEQKKLGEVCQINPPSGNLPDEFIYIDLESVEAGKLLFKKIVRCEEAPSRAQRVLKSSDIIFQMVRPYQKNNLFFDFSDGKTYVASTGYAQLRAKESAEFLYQAIYWDNFVDKVIAKCTGSSYPAINSTDLAEITLSLPTLPEQSRIAAALSSLDAVIAAHQSKLEALRQHKRGLMAGLFPAEGETVPRLRFPEFEGAGEWEERKLGELGTFKGGGTPDKATPDYWAGDIAWISSSDIDSDDIRKISVTRFITEEAIKDSATKKIPSNSILFVSRVGVGKLAVNTNELCTSQDFINFKPSKDDEYFLAYYFKSKSSLLVSFGQGMAIKGFTVADLKSLTLPLPSLLEQQRIAAALSSLDDLMTAQADKIAALQEFKRGLMQRLFPSTDTAPQEAAQ